PRADSGAALLRGDLQLAPEHATRRPVRGDCQANVRARSRRTRLPRRRQRARGDRHHRLLLDRRAGDRGMEARRRPRVRAIRGPRPLVRRVRDTCCSGRARVWLRAGRFMIALPDRVELEDGGHLRFFVVDDAEAVARAVFENLEHLRPWMPWADAQSAEPAFQRDRLRKLPALAERGEEWQYGLFAPDESVLGSFG